MKIKMKFQNIYLPKKGTTGFPWIDAVMKQLKQEGWIHHVCRNSAAMFLTRGDLFVTWEKGFKWFSRNLIDVRFILRKY